MKKNKISYIACMLVAVLLLSACSVLGADVTSVESVVLYANTSEKYIWWQAVSYADYYSVYLNDEKVKDVTGSTNTIVFDYTDYCVREGVNYVFKVKSVSNTYGTSDYSNSVSVLIDVPITNNNSVYNLSLVETDDDLGVNNVKMSASVLRWDEVEDATGYVIITYDNATGYNFYYTNALAIRLTKIPNDNSEILAIKVASVFEDDDLIYVSSNGAVYYNPNSFGEFTSNIYLFDGEIHDAYITSDAELKTFAYYNFINRITQSSFLLSAKYKNEITSAGNALISYLHTSFNNAFCETCNYKLDISSKNSEYMYAYTASWTYSYGAECKINNQNTETGVGLGLSLDWGLKQYSSATYYDRVSYTKRADDFDSFESDHKFLSVSVTSSEQLFWAIEGGFTPIISNAVDSKGLHSRAYYIYKQAKAVLREIISDDMTDYEKALCIHDYLAANYTYDHYSQEGLNSTQQQKMMQYSCYYLEGVFLDSNKLVVCDGFAKAYSMLCNMEGIDCIRVTGEVNSGSTSSGHAWNKVKIDGKWYIVDVTNTELNSSTYEYLAHKLFLVSETEIASYEAFDGRARNTENECEDNLYYYSNVLNDTNLFIRNKQELFAYFDYVFAHNYGAIDFAIEPSFFNELNSKNESGYTYFNVYVNEYWNTKSWLTTFPSNFYSPAGVPVFDESTQKVKAGIVFVMPLKLDLDSLTEEQLADYNMFVENYLAQ